MKTTCARACEHDCTGLHKPTEDEQAAALRMSTWVIRTDSNSAWVSVWSLVIVAFSCRLNTSGDDTSGSLSIKLT